MKWEEGLKRKRRYRKLMKLRKGRVRKYKTVPGPRGLMAGYKGLPGLKILDIYILKKFLGTYFFATILILAVIAMFAITEKLDAFLRAPLKETIFDYFMSFLPYFALQLAPLITFISVIFFTTNWPTIRK